MKPYSQSRFVIATLFLILGFMGCSSANHSIATFRIRYLELYNEGFIQTIVFTGTKIGFAQNMERLQWRSHRQGEYWSIRAQAAAVCANLPQPEGEYHRGPNPGTLVAFVCGYDGQGVVVHARNLTPRMVELITSVDAAAVPLFRDHQSMTDGIQRSIRQDHELEPAD